MNKSYSPQYRAHAKKLGLKCEDLAPFWALARKLATKHFGIGMPTQDDVEYWAYAWSTFDTLTTKLVIKNKTV